MAFAVHVTMMGDLFGFERLADAATSSEPSVDLDVSLDETLGDVLDRAADALGVTPAGPYLGRRPSDIVCAVAFPVADGEPAYYLDFSKLPLVDESGRVFWTRFSQAPYEPLVRSAAAGIFRGDALQPFFMPQVAAGGAGPVEWAALYHALQAIWHIAGDFGPLVNAYGVVSLIRDLAKVVKPARAAISRHESAWHERGAGPPELLDLIRSRPWDQTELARLLGCPEEDVGPILWVAGMTFDAQTGQWAPFANDSAKVRLLAVNCAMYTSGEPGAERELRAALACYSETGEVPKYPLCATAAESADDWDEELQDDGAEAHDDRAREED
jgi:hypothetical protein